MEPEHSFPILMHYVIAIRIDMAADFGRQHASPETLILHMGQPQPHKQGLHGLGISL